jgi:hypothetical protein
MHPPQLVPGAPGVQLGARSGGWPLRFDIYEPRWQLIAAAGGATVSGMAGGGPATSGGARGVKRSLTLGRLSRLEIETMECLQDCSGTRARSPHSTASLRDRCIWSPGLQTVAGSPKFVGVFPGFFKRSGNPVVTALEQSLCWCSHPSLLECHPCAHRRDLAESMPKAATCTTFRALHWRQRG